MVPRSAGNKHALDTSQFGVVGMTRALEQGFNGGGGKSKSRKTDLVLGRAETSTCQLTMHLRAEHTRYQIETVVIKHRPLLSNLAFSETGLTPEPSVVKHGLGTMQAIVELRPPQQQTLKTGIAVYGGDPDEAATKFPGPFPRVEDHFKSRQTVHVFEVAYAVVYGAEKIQVGENGEVCVVHAPAPYIATTLEGDAGLTLEQLADPALIGDFIQAQLRKLPDTAWETPLIPEDDWNRNSSEKVRSSLLANWAKKVNAGQVKLHLLIQVRFVLTLQTPPPASPIEYKDVQVLPTDGKFEFVDKSFWVLNIDCIARNKDRKLFRDGKYLCGHSDLIREVTGKGFVHLKNFMKSLISKLHTCQTAQDKLKTNPSKTKLVFQAGHAFEPAIVGLKIITGAKVEVDEVTQAVEVKAAVTSLARQLQQGVDPISRCCNILCIGEARVAQSELYLTQQDIFERAQILPTDKPFQEMFKNMLENIHDAPLNTPAFYDISPTFFVLTQMEYKTEKILVDPLFLTSLFLFTGLFTLSQVELSSVVNVWALVNDTDAVPESARQKFDQSRRDYRLQEYNAFTQLLLKLLLRLQRNFLGAHCDKFKIKLNDFSIPLRPPVDNEFLAMVKKTMIHMDPSTSSYIIEESPHLPSDEMLDKMIYVVYLKIRTEAPMLDNDFEAVLSDFDDPAKREQKLQEARDFFQSVLAPDSAAARLWIGI